MNKIMISISKLTYRIIYAHVSLVCTEWSIGIRPKFNASHKKAIIKKHNVEKLGCLPTELHCP